MKFYVTALLLSGAASAQPARYVAPSQPIVERYQVQNRFTEYVDQTKPFEIVQDGQDTDEEKVDQDVKVEEEITEEANKELKDEAIQEKDRAQAATSLTSLIVQDENTEDVKVTPPKNIIPLDCTTWFDGCNRCMVSDGIIKKCTKKYCANPSTPFCD